MAMKEIKITDFEGLQIGNAENTEAATGCTVLLFGKDGAPAGLDVRGGGPASRESELLKPMAAAQVIHAILLSGGSAFGLDAAGGVQKYLEERGIGFDVGVTKVPLVCQSDLFDLTVGRMDVRPDAAMGYAACLGAEHNNYRDGNYGAGTGASVGKMTGMGTCMKSGIGSYAVQIGELKIGTIVAVNALGDIYDHHNGQIIAGMLSDDQKSFDEGITVADQEELAALFVFGVACGGVLGFVFVLGRCLGVNLGVGLGSLVVRRGLGLGLGVGVGSGIVAGAAGDEAEHHDRPQQQRHQVFHFGSSYKLLCCRNCLYLADRCVSVTI